MIKGNYEYATISSEFLKAINKGEYEYEYKTQKLCNIKNECNPRSYEWELFPKEMAANQLKQEGGTCYLVSAIESLSHIPNLLEYIFPYGENGERFSSSY